MTLMQTNQHAPSSRERSPARAPLFVFAGGGTGGHLYPALAIAESLRNLLGSIRVVFFGTQRDIDERVLAHAGETLVPQGVKPLTLRPWRWPAFLAAWRASVHRCRAHFATHRPAMVIGSGGFASAPAVRVAARRGIPAALLNPDLIPGKANRWLAGSVECVFAQFPETRDYYDDAALIEATGCPVRPAFRSATRDEGIARFGLDPSLRTLLVTGASLGARSINLACAHLAPSLAALESWQILHLTGRDDEADVRAAYNQTHARAKVLVYTEDMPEAMAAADLMIARAGASTVAEVLAAAVPAILVPYPHHRDQHQLAHALLLEQRGAALTCIDHVDPELTADALWSSLCMLMSNDARRAQMRTSARSLDRPDAAEVIARRILEISGCRARAAN